MVKIKLLLLLFLITSGTIRAQTNPELQPFIFQTNRAIETLDFLGASSKNL
jgi:hypothetical protein